MAKQQGPSCTRCAALGRLAAGADVAWLHRVTPCQAGPPGVQGSGLRAWWCTARSRWDATRPALTWRRFMDNKNAELDRLNGVYMKLLAGANVEFVEGRGRVVDAHTVEVDGRRFTVRAPAPVQAPSQAAWPPEVSVEARHRSQRQSCCPLGCPA